MNFTFKAYKQILKYNITFRHDVDRRPKKSLKMAEIENEYGIKATYYFRMKPESYDVSIINQIIDLGHEVGYHYECLCDSNGDYEKGLLDFEKNLTKLRELYPVTKIAMHGRPTSPHDSRDLWRKYDYRKYGIQYEPYFDTDYNKVLYITDAGRSWNNDSINRRDKVNSRYDFTFKSITDIITKIESGILPESIIINIHPEHWAENIYEWLIIFTFRKVKNIIKKVYLKCLSK